MDFFETLKGIFGERQEKPLIGPDDKELELLNKKYPIETTIDDRLVTKIKKQAKEGKTPDMALINEFLAFCETAEAEDVCRSILWHSVLRGRWVSLDPQKAVIHSTRLFSAGRKPPIVIDGKTGLPLKEPDPLANLYIQLQPLFNREYVRQTFDERTGWHWWVPTETLIEACKQRFGVKNPHLSLTGNAGKSLPQA